MTRYFFFATGFFFASAFALLRGSDLRSGGLGKDFSSSRPRY